MKYIIAVVCMAAMALAGPGEEVAEPLPFHYRSTGDVDGSYSFSYASDDSSKTEERNADGMVVGGYQYVDTDGVLQQVQYQAGVDGVQILASNLPVGSTEPVKDTPEVLRATQEHKHAVEKMIQLIARSKLINEAYERKLAARKALEEQHHQF